MKAVDSLKEELTREEEINSYLSKRYKSHTEEAKKFLNLIALPVNESVRATRERYYDLMFELAEQIKGDNLDLLDEIIRHNCNGIENFRLMGADFPLHIGLAIECMKESKTFGEPKNLFLFFDNDETKDTMTKIYNAFKDEILKSKMHNLILFEMIRATGKMTNSYCDEVYSMFLKSEKKKRNFVNLFLHYLLFIDERKVSFIKEQNLDSGNIINSFFDLIDLRTKQLQSLGHLSRLDATFEFYTTVIGRIDCEPMSSLINITSSDIFKFLMIMYSQGTDDSELEKIPKDEMIRDFFKSFYKPTEHLTNEKVYNFFQSVIILNKWDSCHLAPIRIEFIKNRISNSDTEKHDLETLLNHIAPMNLLDKTSFEDADFNQYMEFKNKFFSVNKNIGNENKVDFYNLLETHSNNINSLNIVLEPTTFTIFKRYLVASALPLERALKNLPDFPIEQAKAIKKSFVQYNIEPEKEGNSHEVIFYFISMFLLNFEVSQIKFNSYESFHEYIDKILMESRSLSDAAEKLGENISDNFLKKKEIIKRISYKDLISRIPGVRLCNLFLAKNKMENHYCSEIFDQFLISDLTGMAYKPNDNVLAHNSNIRNTLKRGNIDIEKAFDTNRKAHEFFLGGKLGEIDIDKTVRTFWKNLNELNKSESTNPKLSKLIQDYQNVTLKKTNRDDNLSTEQVRNILSRVKSSFTKNTARLEVLLKALKNLNLSNLASVKLLKNLEDDIVSLKDACTNEFFNPLISKKQFKIVHWDKASPETFHLGTAVSCCLAPNGKEFPAMVQRRMDDSTFFHVVIDTNSNKPVSLAWLYFAKAKHPDAGIYVVANFFEISPSYAYKDEFRDNIAAALQEYIAAYAADIGAKGFMISPTHYGLITNFTTLPTKKIAFEKVGGYLSDQGNAQSYYLTSLSASEFYEYPLPILQPPSAPSALVLQLYKSNSSEKAGAAKSLGKSSPSKY